MARFLLFVIGCVALAGCIDTVEAPTRNFTFNFDLDDPVGLYCVELRNDERMAIRENLTLPIRTSHVTLDRAFLQNALVKFQHRDRPIPNGAYQEGKPSPGLHYWLVRRDEREIWYYIGTLEQYASLDRNRPHTVGHRVIQL